MLGNGNTMAAPQGFACVAAPKSQTENRLEKRASKHDGGLDVRISQQLSELKN